MGAELTDPRVRANAANRELEQTSEAFAALRQSMIDELIATPVQRALEREKLYLGINALDAVKAALMAVIDSGRIEQAAEEIRAGFAPRDWSREPFSRAA